MGVMIPQKFAEHCKSIKATVDFSTFGSRQKKNIYKMVKTAKFGSSYSESPTTVIAKSIYDETKQPYFQINGDTIAMYNIPSTHPVINELKSYYALCKLLPKDNTDWKSEKSSKLYDKLVEAQEKNYVLNETGGYWDGFAMDLHRNYGEPNPPEFKDIIRNIKNMAVLEMPEDSPAVIKAQEIVEGKVTEMTFNYVS
ncbi:MAG: hypothetical protein ACR2M9_02670 [Cyanophyceae cyanobacterium]